METIITFLKETMHSDLALLTLTVVIYYMSQLLYRRYPILIFNPVLISVSAIIVVLQYVEIPFDEYYEANEIINFGLNLSVIALSYLMHKNIKRISEYKLSLMTSTFCGSIIGIVSVILLSRLIGCDETIGLSLAPKSVTTAIAMSLSDTIGGIPAITAVGVVVTGTFGSIIGPSILKICHITDPVAKGAGMGSAAHAIGTARALEMGAVEGAVGGAAICLMGLFTSIMLPIINAIL